MIKNKFLVVLINFILGFIVIYSYSIFFVGKIPENLNQTTNSLHLALVLTLIYGFFSSIFIFSITPLKSTRGILIASLKHGFMTFFLGTLSVLIYLSIDTSQSMASNLRIVPMAIIVMGPLVGSVALVAGAFPTLIMSSLNFFLFRYYLAD